MTAPIRLEMHQAGKGDLLAFIHGGGRSVIIDSGTGTYANTLGQLLAQTQCELLVLTHLDADHFGGLRELLQRQHSGQIPNVRWPAKILVNHFEPAIALDAIREAAGGDGEEGSGDVQGLIGRSIAAAQQWIEENREAAVEKGSDEVLRGDGPTVVRVDAMAFDYLRATAATGDDRISERELSSLHHFALINNERELHEWVHDSVIGMRPHKVNAEHGVLFLDGAVVIRRRDPGSHVQIRRRTKRADNQPIPSDLPPSVRGLLHMQLRGTPILDSLRETAEAITLIEALKGVSRLQKAQAGDRETAFDRELRLVVLGPDDTELDELRKKWAEIRLRGQIHTNFSYLAFLEASMFAADAGRYKADSSVTNRSSIQIFAETDRACAILTGDGRPDTLERVLDRIPLPSRECRVFKAAHHGSDHNIDISQNPNRVLSRFQPQAIWVSAGDSHHPSRPFLDYLSQQTTRPPLFITNRNAHVDAMEQRLDIEIMNAAPFVSEL